jgi:hypothetical protein
MNPRQIIRESLGAYLKQSQPGYPTPLPIDLESWYCYTVDGGHSILGLIAAHAEPWPDDPKGLLVPIPVKSVLRGYRIEQGYVVATSPAISYDRNLGLVVPREDDEY